MCKMILSSETEKNLNIIVYNLALAHSKNTFTLKDLNKAITDYKIDITELEVNQLITSWVEAGMIYDNMSEYVLCV